MSVDEPMITADDVRRELEVLGYTSAVDRNDLKQVALDAYSEVWEPSQHLRMDHEKALMHAIAAVAAHTDQRHRDTRKRG